VFVVLCRLVASALLHRANGRHTDRVSRYETGDLRALTGELLDEFAISVEQIKCLAIHQSEAGSIAYASP
jgi:hypothetical protein